MKAKIRRPRRSKDTSGRRAHAPPATLAPATLAMATPRDKFRIFAIAALVGLVSACGPGEDEKPGGVSRDDAKALDAAAEMLDARAQPALPEATVPVQEAPMPSAR